MIKKEINVPVFVSVVAFLLGVLDVIRGFMHTFMIEFTALHLAGLDLTTKTAGDSLHLMLAFGLSNFITGVFLILVAFCCRGIALLMLGFIPLIYCMGYILLHVFVNPYYQSDAVWLGSHFLIIYLGISAATFILGITVILSRKCT